MTEYKVRETKVIHGAQSDIRLVIHSVLVHLSTITVGNMNGLMVL